MRILNAARYRKHIYYKNGMRLLVDYDPRKASDDYYLFRSDGTTIFILKIPKLPS